jgi:hypothetical protein
MKINDELKLDLFFIGLLLVILVALLGISFVKESMIKCEALMITQVGGCDAAGDCGVKFSDGTFGVQPHAVQGMKVKVCR